MTPRWRWSTVLLALAAGVAFALSVQGGRWWVIENAELGPFGARLCHDGVCNSGGLASIGGDVQWARFGVATWGAGLISLFVLLVMSAAVAAKRVPRLVAKTVLVSITTAALVGGAFVAKFPHELFATASLGRGAVLFAIAIVLALVAAILVLRFKR